MALPTLWWLALFIVAWYISNVSIIFDCSMLYYLLFWTILGFIFHFYIIFGTNLLTGGPAQIAVFLPNSVSRRKGISNGVQTEWNLRERDFLTERDPGDLDPTARDQRGGHEGGGRPPPSLGRAPCLVEASRTSRLVLQVSWVAFVPRKILPKVSFRLIFLFCETLK